MKRIDLQHRSHRHFPLEIDDTIEQRDVIEPPENVKTDLVSDEQQHRTRRRSSVQILDIKFLHTLTNQLDNESNDPINAPEDVCECE